uniref:Hes family bHLH transcription factor 4 n=1 Tax=Rousettus aegyptiacus TaxID=9407 RepID=A0A7J8K9A8_ROUAE|nr:hes family bHLH transcription factor 4 [Rousettus aegyptiacus]
MPADTPGKPRASPLAGAPASASRAPNKPRSAAEHRKVGPDGAWVARMGRGRADAGLSRSPTRSPPSRSWRSGAERASTRVWRSSRPSSWTPSGKMQICTCHPSAMRRWARWVPLWEQTCGRTPVTPICGNLCRGIAGPMRKVKR